MKIDETIVWNKMEGYTFYRNVEWYVKYCLVNEIHLIDRRIHSLNAPSLPATIFTTNKLNRLYVSLPVCSGNLKSKWNRTV